VEPAPRAAAPSVRLGQEPPGLRRWLATWILSRLGWTARIAWPDAARVVVIVYPHTSNWDFFLGYLARLSMGLPASWIGKHTIFRWPLGPLLRRMGGIPVDRAHTAGLLEALLREFERRPTMCLALAPEGTRTRLDHLKSGFYRLALQAKVPVGLAWLDFARREIVLETWLHLTGDEEVDLGRIRQAYQGKVGRHPEKASEIRFRPERPAAAPPPGRG